ncbi:type VI secretion system membrane subunit TssM [Alteromonas sp. ASW11-130]|uniref:type VI secretion system membrane subunit TssM n=1 Tax=Alteromonas sp. ASW11-130 TaxID=3015775 RepID=UPI00224199F9|nr:type VI secretion system membrane subunit TssM [Alteromonas sp. ASW11-130]MCW8090305.1 type VI secretion system membrane subunit TssM [Alteromonas sp. ASW11-130]
MASKSKWKRIIQNKWLYRGVGFVSISFLIWFVGPLIAIGGHYFLDSIAERLVVIGLIVIFVLIYIAIKRARLKAKSKSFADKLKLEGERREEADAVSSRFDEAMSTLKAATSSKGEMLIQQLPWYILIGPPGSGKTTILNNSGLEFPLAEDLGVNTVQGIGGTRHCDWWFSNEAVLIDTAGRFTTQDSNKEVDKAAWKSFLNVLKKNRRVQPINGVLITASISELLSKSENEKKLYSKTIRRRVDELSEELGFCFPIYFIFTKCDLIRGFSAYFSSITPHEREQVFGHTFTYEFAKGQDQAFDITEYEEYFDELINRLNEKLTLQLSTHKDKSKKAEILAFPAQLASYKKHIQTFLTDIFAENKFQRPAMLRGIYYTSGTQQGSPLDSLLGSIALEMGVGETEDLHFSGLGKSFFIKDLLTKVIFVERNISTFDYRKERLHKRLQLTSIAAALIICVLLSGLFYKSYQDNLTKIAAIDHIADNQKALVRTRENRVPTFTNVIAELDNAYSGMNVFKDDNAISHLGLSQKSSLNRQIYATYLSTLETRLLPLVKARLEKNIAHSLENGETIDTNVFLKAYLLYAGKSESIQQSEKDWLQTLTVEDWQQGLRLNSEAHQSLAFHFNQLLKSAFAQIQVNEDLLTRAQAALRRRPIEELVYADLKFRLEAEFTKRLTFHELSGPDGAMLFKANTMGDLSEVTIPQLFTKQGFVTFSEQLSEALSDKVNDAWILGQEKSDYSKDEIKAIEANVFALYESDYIKAWQAFLNQLAIRQPYSIESGTEVMLTLHHSTGPLNTLLSNVAYETYFDADRSVKETISKIDSITKNANERLRKVIRNVNKYSQNQADKEIYPGYNINKHFNLLHQVALETSGQNTLSKLSDTLAQFSDMILTTLSDSFSESPALDKTFERINGGRQSEFNNLNVSSRTFPSIIKTWVDDVAELGWQLLLLQSKEEIQERWGQQVWSIYEQTLNNRYPLIKNSEQEAELIDFVSFFKPDGVLDSFSKEYIYPFIETQNGGWKLRNLGGKTIQFDAASLNRIKQLSNITNTFFKDGRDTPSLLLSFTPLSLDASATKFSLIAGGQVVEYAHGPRRTKKINWPLPPSNDESRLSFRSASGNKYEKVEQGPWSLFHIFDEAKIAPTYNGSTYTINFSHNSFSAVYEMRADSEINPLSLIYLGQANLPENL